MEVKRNLSGKLC